MGSLSGTDWHTVAIAVVPLAIGVVPLLFLSWKTDLLSLGDEDALTLGVDVNRLRGVLVISATLATSAVIATCGLIGWVGLVVPHLARKVTGSSHTKVFPASALFGALFLLLVDDTPLSATSRSHRPPTAFVGSPFFLFLMLRERTPLSIVVSGLTSGYGREACPGPMDSSAREAHVGDRLQRAGKTLSECVLGILGIDGRIMVMERCPTSSAKPVPQFGLCPQISDPTFNYPCVKWS
jgi:hypothetical protein